MLEQSVTYDPRNGYPLHVTAKRYWTPELETNASNPGALTLILLHSTSFHKETWEPSLEQLLRLSTQPGSPVKIREAWAVDCPNHGEAGQLNERVLSQSQKKNGFTCEKYAQAVHHFFSAGPNYGARIDFQKRNLVGIGHSLGGNAILMMQHIEPLLPFSSLVIVEPMISPAGPQHLNELRSVLVKGAYERRDVWSDRATALRSLGQTKKWDPRVTKLFVRFALRPHPGSYCTETPYPGVTLVCSRDQEAAMYRDAEGPTKPVLDLNKACVTRSVHLVIGEVNDFIPASVHATLLDPQSGRKYTSVTKLAGIGHLIPQESPESLGAVLYEALAIDAKQALRSKM